MSFLNADLDSLQSCKVSTFLLEMLCPQTLLCIATVLFMLGHRCRASIGNQPHCMNEQFFLSNSFNSAKTYTRSCTYIYPFLDDIKKNEKISSLSQIISFSQVYTRETFLKEVCHQNISIKLSELTFFLKLVFVLFSYLDKILPRIYM